MNSSLALLGGEPARTRPFPSWPIFGLEEETRLLSALRSGKWGKLHGDAVAELERRFAQMHGCKHGIAVVNGTVALRIALMAAGIRAEQEVIVPPYTFLATATAVVEANAVPVFADVDLETDALASACRSIHNCGRLESGTWYEHHVMSGNYRLGEFQGAVLNAQLDRLEAQTQTRDRNGRRLAAELSRIPGIYPQKRPADCGRHSYHLFLFRVDPAVFGVPRDAILEGLRAEGVPVSAGYALPLYRQPLFLNKAFGPYLSHASLGLDYSSISCPNCEKICGEQGAWLEQNLLLGLASDMEEIARAFQKVHEHRAVLNRFKS